MAFQIVDADTGEFYTPPHGLAPVAYEEGAAAQAAAKELSRQNGRKYRVKRVTDNNWMMREQAKFDNDSYERLPWADQEWWNTLDCQKIWQKQFPHISKKEPGMIAYTESAEKGMDNKRTWIKPGRYLEKYFSSATRYFGVDVPHLIRQFEDLTKNWTVHFAKTEDEIEYVYRNGPDSCMSSDYYRQKHGWGYPEKGQWPDNYHACRVYAAGDLQVAYIKDKEKDEGFRVVARALVWPEKKTHSRCYGNEPVLKNELRKMGYKFAPPLGAKLLRKPHGKQFIVPYVDQGDRSGAGALAIKDMKDHLLIVQHGPFTYACNCTSGLSGKKMGAHGDYDDGAGTCAACEQEEVDTQRVFMGAAGGDYSHYCERCRDENAFQCMMDGRWYHRAYVQQVTLEDGHVWAEPNFRAYGFTCSYDGKRYNRDSRVGVITADGTKYVHRDNLKNYAFQCDYTGDWFRNDELVKMKHGGKWSKRAFRHAGFKCKTCDDNVRMMDLNGIVAQESGEMHCVHCKPLQVAERKPKRKKTEDTVPVSDTSVFLNEAADATDALLRVDLASVEAQAVAVREEMDRAAQHAANYGMNTYTVAAEDVGVYLAPNGRLHRPRLPIEEALLQQVREYTYHPAENGGGWTRPNPQAQVEHYVLYGGRSGGGGGRLPPVVVRPVEPAMAEEEIHELNEEPINPLNTGR